MALKPDPRAAQEEDIRLLAAFIDSADSARLVPDVFVRVMEQGTWKHWKNKLGREVTPRDFEEFVTTPYPSGIGTTMAKLKGLVEEDDRADEFYRAMIPALQDHGTNRFANDRGNNVTSTDRGNAPTYAIARLRRDAPEIHAEVVAGGSHPYIMLLTM